MITVSIQGIAPPPRFDGQAWFSYRIEQSISPYGPWVVLTDGPLIGVDADPTHPLERNFTVAADTPGLWFRVVFLDQSGDQEVASSPVLDRQQTIAPWAPTLQQVAGFSMSRTMDRQQNMLGTFTVDTKPTAAQVERFIYTAATDVKLAVGDPIPVEAFDFATQATAIRAAILIEINLFPEQVRADSGTYDRLLAMYNKALADTTEKVASIEAANNTDDTTSTATTPHFNFDQPYNPVGPFRLQGPVGWGSRW